MKKLFLLSVLFCAIACFGQTTWEKRLNIYHNGQLAAGEPSGMVETPDKGFIISGQSLYQNQQVGYIYKVDANGDSVWCKTFANPGFKRVANVFYNRNNELMVAMEYDIAGKKQNIVFAKLNETNGDTSNSFVAAKPNNAEGYMYTAHVEMADGSYIVLATDVSSFVPGASHLFRFMPGSDTHIWSADSLAKRVWTFYDMIVDNNGLVLAGNANTGTFRHSYIVVRYGFNGVSQWNATYPVISDYLTSYSRSVIAGSSNYISVGDKIEKIDNILQSTPAVAIIGKNGDTISYNILATPVFGTIRKIIKAGGNYYGLGQIKRNVKAPDNSNVAVYKMALFSISESGSFSIIQEYDFGIFSDPFGTYIGSMANGRSMLVASDGDLVLWGTGTYKRADSTTYTGTYIVKTKATTVPSGITPAGTANGLSLYPNPVTDRLMIDYAGANGTLKILNIMGQEVYSNTINEMNREEPIETSHLPAGTYIVQFSNGTTMQTAKFIKTI